MLAAVQVAETALAARGVLEASEHALVMLGKIHHHRGSMLEQHDRRALGHVIQGDQGHRWEDANPASRSQSRRVGNRLVRSPPMAWAMLAPSLSTGREEGASWETQVVQKAEVLTVGRCSKMVPMMA